MSLKHKEEKGHSDMHSEFLSKVQSCVGKDLTSTKRKKTDSLKCNLKPK